MAEDVVVCFYNSTAPSVSGKTINAYNSGLTAGQLDADLSGYDTGAASGISFDLGTNRVADNSGRLAGADTLTQEVNRQGCYHNQGGSGANFTDVFTLPASVSQADVEVYLCTTYAQQGDIDVTINGTAAATAFDSTANTTGATVTLAGVTPDGSNQINILVEEPDQFLFVNGYRLYNIQSGIGATTDTLVITEQNASISLDINIASTTDSLIVTEYAASINSGANVNCSFDALTVTEYPVTIGADTIIAAGTDPLVITEYAATIQSTLEAVADTFDGTGALGSHWLNYQSSVQTVDRQAGYLEIDVGDNTGNKTLWFNADRGRMDYQRVRFPTGALHWEYRFLNIGIGPTSDPRDDHAYVSGAVNFCGAIVHDADTATNSYMFEVIGHRTTLAQSTIEHKSTIAGVSDVGDEGTNVIGTDVTHCDMGVELYNDGSAKFKYRAVGTTSWTYINGGTGSPAGTDPNLGAGGDEVLIGVIGYAQHSTGVPFVGSLDAFEAFEGTFQTAGLSITTYPAEVIAESTVLATTGALSITTYPAQIPADTNISATVDPLVITEYQASISAGSNIAATFDPLVITANQADVSLDVTIQTGLDPLVVTTNSATVNASTIINATSQAVTLTEQPATLQVTINATSASITATGQSATITFDRTVTTGVRVLSIFERTASVNGSGQDLPGQVTKPLSEKATAALTKRVTG